MPERERRPRRRLPSEVPQLEQLVRPEVLNLGQGAQAVAERIVKLWGTQTLVIGSLYGEPNVGKSHFTEAVQKAVATLNGDEYWLGGELTGYDEVPKEVGKSWKEFQLVAEPALGNVGEPY